MSLIELLVALGILSIVTLAANTMLTRVIQAYSSVSERVAQEKESIEIAYTLKHYLSMAIELHKVPDGNSLGNQFSSRNGKIRSYDLGPVWQAVSGPGAAEPLAVFFRETLRSTDSNLPANGDRFLPTGIFFIRPTTDRFGVLAIDTGSADTPTISGRSVEFRFTHIVDLKIHDFVIDNTDGRNNVSSFLITFTRRAYKPSGQAHDFKWCPPSRMTLAACRTQSRYIDINRTLEVIVRNNVLGLSSTRRTETRDSIGRSIYTAGPRRTFEGIYFLRPFTPLDALKR
jgi:prepilin-type N-terminal cleavage/methylation domain-containing protein